MYFKRNIRTPVIFAILIILSVTVLTIHYKEGGKNVFDSLGTFVLSAVAPVESGVSKVVYPFQYSLRYLKDMINLREENVRLKKEVAKLKKETVDLKTLKKENKRLRSLLGFSENTDYKTVPAYIVGRSITNWEATVIIDKGTSDGIKKHMPVVVAEGLVGQVVKVTAHASLVRLIADQESGVGAEVQGLEEAGVVKGKFGGKLELTFISKDSQVKKGDDVITSGMGGVFPRGILIGKVGSVKTRPYSLYKEIEVKSDVDFPKLIEVLVVTKPYLKSYSNLLGD